MGAHIYSSKTCDFIILSRTWRSLNYIMNTFSYHIFSSPNGNVKYQAMIFQELNKEKPDTGMN